MSQFTRRTFLQRTIHTGLAVGGGAWAAASAAQPNPRKGRRIRFGLVTYQWGKDWDLPTLLANCARAEVLGVELRTTHAHGVEPTLGTAERKEVRKTFADSPVECVGLGSNERFDSPDPAKLRQAIAATKRFLELSHDVGASGVKVKPNDFHKDVPRETTIAQIGGALNELGEFGQGLGQQVRLEVHGGCAELPTIRKIMDVADHPSVAVCWNSNPQDLEGEGIEHNFGLVQGRFGATAHIHRLDDGRYPYPQLFELFVRADYQGWLMLEEGRVPVDPAAELVVQRKLFEKLLSTVRRAGD